MLVVNRRPGESLEIDYQFRITVIRVNGHRVKIGIETPRDCRVLRSELDSQATVEDQSTGLGPEKPPADEP